MTNLFEFLKNYKDPKAQQSYGDILEDNSILSNLSPIEQSFYNQFKAADKMRLIKSGMKP